MTRFPDDIEAALAAAAPAGIALTRDTDAKGVTVAWCTLTDRRDLLPAATVMKARGARLSTITAFQPKPPEPEEGTEGAEPPPPAGVVIDGHAYELAYHFDLDGDTLTLVVLLPPDAAEVDSLTPLFRNADWNEREFMEIYAIRVKGHPDPRRLFIDESVEPAVLERLIPFSTLVNAASTSTLWEKIMAKKEGAKKEGAKKGGAS